MIELLSLSTLLLLAVCVMQRFSIIRGKGREAEVRRISDSVQSNALATIERLAETSTLNAKEISEAIAEQSTTLEVESDIWKMPLPYGRWQKFPDEKGRPPPEIRGFWVDYPGRLIGVKMPIGSEYDMHSHPWPEILIGGSGVVWVEIENENREISKHRLGPEDVVVISSGARHAVLTAETEAHFICIWGKPKT